MEGNSPVTSLEVLPSNEVQLVGTDCWSPEYSQGSPPPVVTGSLQLAGVFKDALIFGLDGPRLCSWSIRARAAHRVADDSNITRTSAEHEWLFCTAAAPLREDPSLSPLAEATLDEKPFLES